MRWDKLVRFVLVLMAALLFVSAEAEAWPVEADWIGLVNATGFCTDPVDDNTGPASMDIVGDATHPAAMLYNDGTYIYYRIRIDSDPVQGGYLKQFGWGLLIDTNLDGDMAEFMVSVDGIVDEVQIQQNTSQSTLGDPSDAAEVTLWEEPLNNTPGSENFKVVSAGSVFPVSSPDADYWIEYRYPIAVWYYYMGLTDDSVVRYFIGSGPNGRVLSSDLMGTSLYTNMSSPLTPTGVPPTTGSVMFVANLAGTGDVTDIYPGQTIYIKVTDLDQDHRKTLAQTITVIINAPSGDQETVTLTETGLSTGIFTGSILTEEDTLAVGDGTLQLSPIETVTVRYLDVIDAALLKNQPRYDYLTANPSTDLSLAMVSNTVTPNEGQNIIYTITIHNNGASAGSSIQVTDTLPAGLTYVSDDGGGAYNPSSHIWTVGTLANGASKVLNITLSVNSGTSGTSITKQADITFAAQYDPNTANNTASVLVTVQGADMEISKTVSNATPLPGTNITYTITALNKGTNNATNVVVKDLLNAGNLSYVSSTPAGYSTVTGLWPAVNILSGASQTYTITGNVTGVPNTIVPNITNIVSADQADPVSSNNTFTRNIAISGVDLVLTNVVNSTAPNVGDNVRYLITLINNSTNGATGITVTNPLPSQVTYVSATAGTGSASYAGGTVTWTPANLAPGIANATTLQIWAKVNKGTASQTVSDTASITAVAQADVDTSNNSYTASFTVIGVDLALTKTVNNPAPSPSTNILYTIGLTNNGPDTATSIQIKDLLPAGITFVSSTPSIGGYVSGTGIWSGFSLINGASATLLINATTPATSGTTYTNTASVFSIRQEDRVLINNSASAAVTVGGVDLKITKTTSNASPSAGQTGIVYTVTVQNIGLYQATGIEVIDSLPGDVTLTNRTLSQGSWSNPATRWNVGPLDAGITATMTMTVTVNAGTDGNTIENTARISAIDQTDIDLSNNISKAYMYVGSTNLGLAKTADDASPDEGGTVMFTVTLTNIGPNTATNVDVTDLLPSGLTFVNSNAGAYYNSATGIWNATNTGSTTIPNGAVRTLIINATVNSGTGGSTIINQAQITHATQLDPDTTNNLASYSITVQKADLSIQKTADDTTPDEGTNIMFTVSITNLGPNSATNILARDKLPAGFTYLNSNAGGNYNSGTGDWTIGILAKNATATLIINATADMGTGGSTLYNIANIVSADQADSDTTNNTFTLAVTPYHIPSPNIQLSKAVLVFWDPVNLANGNQKAIPGAEMTYTISVWNFGDGEAETVYIEDPLPSEVEMFVGDMGAGQPVLFTDGTGATTSGLSLSSLQYSNSAVGPPYTYGYGPSGTFDPSVKVWRANLSGNFNAMSGGNVPTFTLKFKVRIKS